MIMYIYTYMYIIKKLRKSQKKKEKKKKRKNGILRGKDPGFHVFKRNPKELQILILVCTNSMR